MLSVKLIVRNYGESQAFLLASCGSELECEWKKGTACESSHGHYGLMGPASWNSSATEGTVEQDTGSTALTTLYRPYTPVVKEDPPVPGYFIHLSSNQRKKTGSLRERPA